MTASETLLLPRNGSRTKACTVSQEAKAIAWRMMWKNVTKPCLICEMTNWLGGSIFLDLWGFFFKCKPSYFYLFDCVLRRIWSPQWTGCRISTQCTHQSSWTSQNQWLSTRKNTSRRFLTSSKIQIKGKLLRRIKALINIKTVNLSFSNKIIIRSAKRENCHCVFQPSQQLHDHEGGEEDGIRLGSEVSGNRAALPGGHVWNQKGERRCSTDLFPDREKGKIKQIGF